MFTSPTSHGAIRAIALCGSALGLAALAPVASAEPAPTSGPPALVRLTQDTARLPREQRSRSLLLARAAQAEAGPDDVDWCGTMRYLERYRELLAKLKLPAPDLRPRPPKVDEDLLRARVTVLGSGRTQQCGGAFHRRRRSVRDDGTEQRRAAAAPAGESAGQPAARTVSDRLALRDPARRDPGGAGGRELELRARRRATGAGRARHERQRAPAGQPVPRPPCRRRRPPSPTSGGCATCASARSTSPLRRYSARTRRLRVYTSMTVTITFGGANQGVFADDDVRSEWNVAFIPLYRSSFVNSDIALARRSAIPRRTFCGEEMLIITAPSLRPAANTLAAAREKAGIRTAVVETGVGTARAGTTAGQIRATIGRHLHSRCAVHPSYVVLVGDTTHVPTFRPANPAGQVRRVLQGRRFRPRLLARRQRHGSPTSSSAASRPPTWPRPRPSSPRPSPTSPAPPRRSATTSTRTPRSARISSGRRPATPSARAGRSSNPPRRSRAD